MPLIWRRAFYGRSGDGVFIAARCGDGMEVLVLASRTGDSDLGLAFSGMTLTMLAQMWRAEMWKNRTAWQGTNVPRLRLKQDGRRARNPARGFAAECR